MAESAVRIVLVYPELLGTYGDRGNAEVLQARLRWRGVPVELLEVAVGDDVPAGCDLYVLGGGEDAAQLAALDRLRRTTAVPQAVQRGAAVFAVCAGFQLLGTSMLGPDGADHPGMGLLDVWTGRGTVRAVGEVVAEPLPATGLRAALTGYENHAGVTTLGPAATPLGAVRSGVGNGVADPALGAVEGAVQGRITATYLHGPVLARNPELADAVLAQVVGDLPPLQDPGVAPLVDGLRRERLSRAT